MDNYIENIRSMELSVIECLSKLEKGYGNRKWYISKQTGIPIDILTVILKRLKWSGKIELIMMWCEEKGTPNGSGYRLQN